MPQGNSALNEIDLNFLMFRNDEKTENLYSFELTGCFKKPEISLKTIEKENLQFLVMKAKNNCDYPQNFKCVDRKIQKDTSNKKIKINDQHGHYICDKNSRSWKMGS